MITSAPMRLAPALMFWLAAAIPSYGQVFDNPSQPTSASASGGITGAQPINLSPKRLARLHHDRAIQLADAGRTSEAIEEDRQAIATDPNRPGYQILLGSLLIDKGQLGSALAVYEHVIARFPDQEPYLQELIGDLRMGQQLVTIEHAINRLESGQPKPNGACTQVFLEVIPGTGSSAINPDPYTADQPAPPAGKLRRATRALADFLLSSD